MLYLANVKKSYGSFEVLDVKDLRLSKGKYWIKGPNGSGKSTLLKIIAGLLPFKGDVLLNDTISIHKNPVQYRALVNHAPAEPAYPSFVSGQQLVDFYKSTKKGHAEQIEELKHLLGITHFLNNPTGTYSSGMLKKLSLLLAFIGNPAVILLDEPFTTLDVETQQSLQSLIKNRQGTGFLLTSHHDIAIDDIEFTNIFSVKDKSLAVE